MFCYNLLCSYFRRHIKRNRILEPRRVNHSRLIALYVAESARNNIAYAVNKTDVHCRSIVNFNFNALFGDEFWLGRHYGASRRGLRQLVVCSLLLIGLSNVG